MNNVLTDLLDRFQIELEFQNMPDTIGGYYTCGLGARRLVVNWRLPFPERLNACFELIFKYCLEERECSFILYDLSQKDFVCVPMSQGA